MSQPKFLAFDTETGGVSVKFSLFTAYFAVMTESKEIISELTLKLKPRGAGGYIYAPEALRHNGIDPAELFKIAISLEEATEKLKAFLAPHIHSGKLTPLGQNVPFDLKFTWEYLLPEKEWLTYCTEEVADTLELAKKLKKAGKLHVNALKLGVLCEHMGIPLINAHTERDDTIAAAHLHTRLKQLELRGKSAVSAVKRHDGLPPTASAPLPFDSPLPLPMVKVLSSFSILQSPSSVDDYIDKAVKSDSPCLAVADLGYAISALEVWDKAKKKNIAGIPATVIFVADGPSSYDLTLWAVTEKGYSNLLKISSLSWSKARMDGRQRHQDTGIGPRPRVSLEELLPLLEGIAVGTGSHNGLLGRKTPEEAIPVIDAISATAAAVFLEVVPRPLTHKFDPSVGGFVEIVGESGEPIDLQARVNARAIEISKKHAAYLILSCDAHYVELDDRDAREMLVSSLDPTGTMTSHRSLHVPTMSEAWAYFESMHGSSSHTADNFINATLGAYKLFDMARDLKIKTVYRLPDAEIPEDLMHTAADYREAMKATILRQVDFHGRMKWDEQEWVDRLSHEIDVICDNGEQDFSEYFLFLEKWNEWTRRHSILSAPGRGSGAGSLLCYLLKITHLDPFRHKLPFTRFLSPGRIKRKKWPDIDWDMGDRGPLLAKLAETYGDKFAQCSTHGTLKVKSAIKDAFRVIHLKPLESRIDSMDRGQLRDVAIENLERMKIQVDEVTKTIANAPQGVKDYDFLIGYEDKEGNKHEGHLWTNESLMRFFEEYSSEESSKDLKTMVERMLGVPRSIGRHASAYFISNAPIVESVPLCDVGGHTCTQYVASSYNNYAEKAGLIKFDFLGVKTLLDISNCVRLVHKFKGYKTWLQEFQINGETFKLWQGDLPVEQIPGPDGEVLDIYNLPEDAGVFKDLCEGKTESVFQQCSPLMTGFTKQIKPSCLNDQSIIVALVRPGPLKAKTEQDHPTRKTALLDAKGKPILSEIGESKMVKDKVTMAEAYILRKHGQLPVSYAHPDMEPILQDTFGVAVFQEQLQQMFSDLAGYSPEEADYLRELVSKKKKQDMEKVIPELKERLTARGWSESQTQIFVNLCISSAEYSFNRAHSASYGTVAYMCAWLKHHYPKEWWTAVLQNCKVEDIRENGYDRPLRDILVLPHVNGPTETFEPRDDGKVHSPLWLIDGVADAACGAIKKALDQRIEEVGTGGLSLPEHVILESQFGSLQDFWERVDQRACNAGIMKRLFTVGAFEHIEPLRSPKSLMLEYLTLRKVSSLKIGEGKRGIELKSVCNEWYEKNKDSLPKDFQESMAEMEMDGVELQIRRMELLPIYRNDVHDSFGELLKKFIVYHDSGVATYRTKDRNGHPQMLTVLTSGNDVAAFYKKNQYDKYKEAVWVGLLESKDYTNPFPQRPRPGEEPEEGPPKMVKGLKLKVVNAGDSVECMLWPDALETLERTGRKIPEGKKILLCAGPVKPSRTPGMWSMSVKKMMEI